jgi:circadian clock protein KaiB
MQARRNLAIICEAHLAGRYELEIIDVYLEPARALQDSVFMTPTLLKLAPPPQRTIVGALNQTRDVLLALDLVIT